MVGYNILHSISGLEAVLIIVVLPMMVLATILVLISVFCESWYDDVMNGSTGGGCNYSVNTNPIKSSLDKLVDPYYKEEKEMMGVPVLYYKKVAEGYDAVLKTTTTCPIELKWYSEDFTWTWIDKAKRMGWKQDNPPAQPTIIASDGMMAHVERILAEANSTEPVAKAEHDPLQWDKTAQKQEVLINKHL